MAILDGIAEVDPKKKSALLIEVMGWKVDYMTVVTDGRGKTIPFHEIVWTVEGDEHWINLFNECGPEREVGAGNPYEPGDYDPSKMVKLEKE